MQKQQEKFHQTNSNTTNHNQSSAEPKKDSNEKKDTLGEYVDYEEVE